MATLRMFKGVTCDCTFNLSEEPSGHRFLNHDEAKALHQQQYDAEPWRVRLIDPLTGDTTSHVGLPEGGPEAAALMAQGWWNLADAEKTFPRRFKNVSNPTTDRQPLPRLCTHAAHRTIGHRKERFEAVMHESVRLGAAKAVLLARPGFTQEMIDALPWVFTDTTIPGIEGSRVLDVTLPRSQDRLALQAALDLQFGPGTAVVR